MNSKKKLKEDNKCLKKDLRAYQEVCKKLMDAWYRHRKKLKQHETEFYNAICTLEDGEE